MSNHQYVDTFMNTADDPCPSYKPNQCDGGRICYSNNEKCDGFLECNDRSDEQLCTGE